MKEELFNELLESVKEAVKIMKGEIPPSRVFHNLYEVKEEYFPNFTLDQLEGKEKFSWNKNQPKDIFQNTIIICQHCHKNSGYTEEGFRHYVISCDIKCKNCGKIVIEYDNGIRC